jgi:hypothetical protein
MTAEEVLAKLEAAMEKEDTGIEVWFDAAEYKRSKVAGQRFADWVAEMIDRVI